MKVLLLADANSSHVLKWVSGLKSKGVELALFSLVSMTENEAQYYDGVSTHCLDYDTSTSRIQHKLLFLKALKTIKEMHKSFQPDIVHAHYASSYGLLGAILGFSNFFISVWGTDVYVYPKSGAVYRKLFTYSLSKADIVLSTSKDMARETMLYTNKKLKVVPFGVDIDKFKPKGEKPSGSFHFATTKSLRSVYNIPLVIKVFKEVSKNYPSEGLKLFIAGDGIEMSICREIAGDLIGHSIFFKGAIQHVDMPKFLDDKHVLVNIPDSESFGVSILEASAMKMAVIATNRGGIPEVVADGETGVLIDGPQEERLTQVMIQMIEDRTLVHKMGLEGRTFVQNNYTWERSLETQVKVYSEYLSVVKKTGK